MTIKELLKDSLTKKELKHAPSSFEIIGSKEKAVAIVELDFVVKPRAKLIADAIMKKHKNVKSVLLKESARSGEYRTRKYRVITGLKNTEVMHIENGCRLLVDPQTAYFSPRECTERLRIVEMVKEGENVMVFFAGVGPFAVEIAKKAKPARVVGIEINPAALDYFTKNIRLNKLANAEAVLGDVAAHSKEFSAQFDRVLMPLPEKSIEYMKDAFLVVKPGGIVHFYFFENEDKINNWKKRVRDIARSMKKKTRILDIKKVLPYSPRVWKWRMDIQVS